MKLLCSGALGWKLFLEARENRLSTAHLVSGLDAHLRIQWQKNIDARSEPDEADPFAANDLLAVI